MEQKEENIGFLKWYFRRGNRFPLELFVLSGGTIITVIYLLNDINITLLYNVLLFICVIVIVYGEYKEWRKGK